MSKSFESVEIVSYEKARKIYDNWDKIHFENPKKLDLMNEKNKLLQYIKKNTSTKLNKAKIPTVYCYARNKKGMSRQCVQGVGLQNLMRPIRQTISDEYYNDIDMVNSEPTLLMNYCKKAGYKYDAIKYYCENRDICIKKLMDEKKIDKGCAKIEIIKIINGGKVLTGLKWLSEFIAEVQTFHKKISEDPAYTIKLKTIKETKKNYNSIGTLISDIFHNIENACLNKCIEYLKSEDIDIKNLVLVFDGFMIPKSAVNITDKLLAEMSAYVKDELSYDVKYIVKPMNETIDVSKYSYNKGLDLGQEHKLIAEDDNEASELLLNEMEGQIFYSNSQVWVRTLTGRIYISKPEVVESELINRCISLNIMKKAKNEYKPYSGNLAGARSIVQMAMTKIKTRTEYLDNEFVDRMTLYSRDKLFFNNGYIQFGNKIEFIYETDTSDYSIMTPIRIDRDLPEFDKVSNPIIEELRNRVLIPIFGNDELLNNYLAHIARAITGHIEDKDWIILQGMRNCGKGVLAKLNSYTFGNYYAETSANNLIMERMHTVEDPKKYAWLAQNRWVRVLGTSEIKMDEDNKGLKIDGNLIKNKLASGGDCVEVRDLYESQYKIKPQCRLTMMCNDLPPIYPPDAVQTLTKFNFPHEFLSEDEYNTKQKEGTLCKNSKLADPNIKDYVGEFDVCDAFLLLVTKAFKDKKVINCIKVKDDTNDIKADLGDEKTVIFKYFEFTHKKEDFILTSDLNDFHKSSQIKVSITKLRELIKFYGAISDNHVGRTKTNPGSRGYIGVKLIEQKDEL